MSESPHAIYARTGGGDAYRVAMLEAGHIYPLSPWMRTPPGGKRVMQCGLTHEVNWSPWQMFNDAGRDYEARWCRTCGTTQGREAGARLQPSAEPPTQSVVREREDV